MKLFKLSFVIFIIFCLAGCKYSADYIDPEDRYIVSAVAFQKDNSGIKTLIEAPPAKNNPEKTLTVFSGVADSVEKSVELTANKISGELIFSQCPIILIDEGLKGEEIQQIFDFCMKNYDISLSVMLSSCDNPQELLGLEQPVMSVGHTLLKTLTNSNKQVDVSSYARFAKIINDENKNGEFYLPHIIIENETFSIDCMCFYKNKKLENFVNIGAFNNG